ncbi:hypothetical protein RvY_04938 [Ramazzottius varieornatus]|uniref:Peptidase S1 domain-containing protein n=1 Tax=Ramazzottius varieornatus TaxID=947166 RepID=A0A1D1V2G6_RAMVA|nr:hypothetical protein RvY_04938 [Ramazzottius varieornatus]
MQLFNIQLKFFCLIICVPWLLVNGQINLQSLMPLLGMLSGSGGGLGALTGSAGSTNGGGSGLNIGSLLSMVGPLLSASNGGGGSGGGSALSGLLGGGGGGLSSLGGGGGNNAALVSQLSGLLSSSSGGGGGGLTSLLQSGGGGGLNSLSSLLQSSSGGNGLSSLLQNGGGTGLSSLLQNSGGNNNLQSLLQNSGGGGSLGSLLNSAGGGGSGNGLNGLLSGGGGSQLSSLAASLGNGGQQFGGQFGGGGNSQMDSNSLANLLQSVRGSQSMGSLQQLGGGLRNSQGLGSALSNMNSGYSDQGSSSGFSSAPDRNAQLAQLLGSGSSPSQSFGSVRSFNGQSSSSTENMLKSYLGSDPSAMMGSNRIDSILGGNAQPDSNAFRQDQASAEFVSKETKPCFVDGYKGSCMPVSLQGVCQLYGYEIRDGGCINFQTMTRDVCCYRRAPEAMSGLQQPPSLDGMQNGLMANQSPQMASSSMTQPNVFGAQNQQPNSLGQLNSQNQQQNIQNFLGNQNALPTGFIPSQPSTAMADNTPAQNLAQFSRVGGGSFVQSNNPIQNTLSNVMQSQMQQTTGNIPPNVLSMILSTLTAPKAQSPTNIATSLIDGLLTAAITTPAPVIEQRPQVTATPSNTLPPSLTSQISPAMLGSLQAAASNLSSCNVSNGSRGFCMPPSMQGVCQNMNLKIEPGNCPSPQICCARSPNARIPDDLVNTITQAVKKPKRESLGDDMMMEGSELDELSAPASDRAGEARARRACTVSGFDGICVATSLTALCPGLGMQISPSGCESSESCCYSSDPSAAANLDVSSLKEEPLAISFEAKQPSAQGRAPPLATNNMQQLPSLLSPNTISAQNIQQPSPAQAVNPVQTAVQTALPVIGTLAGQSAPAAPSNSMTSGFDIGSLIKTVLPLFISNNQNNMNGNSHLDQGNLQGGLGGGGFQASSSNIQSQPAGGMCGGRGEAASCISRNMVQSCVKMGYRTRVGGCGMDQLCCFTPTNELDRESSFTLDQANKCVIQDHPGICVPNSAARNCSMYNMEVSLYGCSSPELSCCYTRNSVNGQCGVKGRGSAAPAYGGAYSAAINGMPIPEAGVSDPDFVDVGENCWQAALLDRSSGNYFCSAVLIDTIWLLTAAHCVSKRSPMDITVRLGEWDFNVTTEIPGPRDYSVFNLYIHSSFNPKTLENDVAMLKLNRPADISLSNICLVCRPGQIDYYGMNCQASGWGKLGQNFPFSSRLKRITTRIWPNQECAYRLRNSPLGPGFKFQTTSFMCGSATGRQTICNGDGGGPLICSVGGTSQLAGIIVSGIQCGQGGMPALFVNLGQYQAWIDEVMKN